MEVIQTYFANFNIFSLCELIGTIAGLFVLYYQIKEKPVMWILNVVSATFLGINFFANEVYAYALFQIYYIITSIYGLWVWLHGKVSQDEEMPIKKLTIKGGVITAVSAGVLFVLLLYLLRFVGSELAAIDAFITSFSILATFMLALKYYEQWFLWLASDIVYVSSIIYYSQSGMYVTFILYSCYIISAFVGIYAWNKQYKKQNQGK